MPLKRMQKAKLSPKQQPSIMLKIDFCAQITNVDKNNADNACRFLIISERHANKTDSIRRRKNADIAKRL